MSASKESKKSVSTKNENKERTMSNPLKPIKVHLTDIVLPCNNKIVKFRNQQEINALFILLNELMTAVACQLSCEERTVERTKKIFKETGENLNLSLHKLKGVFNSNDDGLSVTPPAFLENRTIKWSLKPVFNGFVEYLNALEKEDKETAANIYAVINDRLYHIFGEI